MFCALVALVVSYWYVQNLLKLEAEVTNNVTQEEL